MSSSSCTLFSSVSSSSYQTYISVVNLGACNWAPSFKNVQIDPGYLFEDQICLPSSYIMAKRQFQTLDGGHNHVCFCELQVAIRIQLHSGCSDQAKWFCWHAHSWLDMRSTISPVIDGLAMAWPLRPVMNMCCLGIGCSMHSIPITYTYKQVLWFEQGCSTYLGAAPIVHVLKTSKADVIITSRVADAALFLAPMVFPIIQLSHTMLRHLSEQQLVISR